MPGTKIIVFYPKGGVSRVQELQMVTQKGDNTSVVAIHGNFDNAQSGVKAMFEDKALEKELEEAGISSHPRTLSISDALFLRLCIMYMLTRNCWKTKRSQKER